jgi:UDP-glucose 4-epimerase
MQMPVILVTGAHGFLGRNVARLSSQRGYRVVGIGHGEWPQSEWESWGLSEWISSDVTLENLRQIEATPSVIVHCAGGGLVSYSIDHPIADFERTVVTTAHVLEYVRKYAPSCRVVYPSSASVYGSARVIPIREDASASPVSQYGVHKLMAEQLVASYARQFGTAAAIIRFFSVYGAGLRKQLLWDACGKFAKHNETFMGTGDELRDWLHVEDAAKLILIASEHADTRCPIANGGSGHGISVRELLTCLGSCFSLGTQPKFSGVERPGDPSKYVADITVSKSWGWMPARTLQRGIEDYVDWWKKEAL